VAILHRRATLTPTKLELAAAWLDRQGLGGSGQVELAGSYRFDDPAGEVGIEALLVRRGGEVFHLPVTYRGAPLGGAEDYLVTTMEHSVLGHRWVYDAAGDPVALGCYAAALAGQQEQAAFELWDGDAVVGHRAQTVTLTAAGDEPAGGGEVRLYRVPGDLAGRPATGRYLAAAWDAGSGIVAAFT
jgi:maltokinase-like protein